MIKQVSINDVAQKANVHPSTVSLALRNSSRISKKTAAKVKDIANELGYMPNFAARGLAGQKTQTIGVVVPKLNDSYVTDVLAAQENWLRENGYASLLFVSHSDCRAEVQGIKELLGRGVDGLVFDCIPKSEEALAMLEDLAKAGKMISFLGDPGIDGVCKVTVDLFEAGYKMTEHLIDLGHKRIALISPQRYCGRLNGYSAALKDAGLEFDEKLVFVCDYVYQDITQLRKEVMSLRDRPTAIFAYNDDLAVELLKEFMTEGYNVPGDISIVGVNDSRYSSMFRVPLTTFRFNAAEIGVAATKMLLDRLEDESIEPYKIHFKGELVQRESAVRV